MLDNVIGIVCNIIIALSSLLSVVLAFYAVKVAKGQLNKIIENQKIDALKIVLEIEAEMNARKSKLDDAASCFMEEKKKQGSSNNQNLTISEMRFKTAKENYFNIVDRFCYCIEKKYIDDLSWRVEYRNYIKNIVDAYPEDFNASTSYRHIANINNEWQST